MILKRHFHMSFRNIRRQHFLGNEPRALVLRQHWAKIFLAALAEKKRVLVVDESWLSSLDQRRRKWAYKSQKNTLVAKEMSKNVNLICGLDTFGKVYVAMHQANTDESVFTAFLTKLVETLQREDRNFRQQLLLVFDGCSFHKSTGTRLTLKRLGLTYAIAAPYAFDS